MWPQSLHVDPSLRILQVFLSERCKDRSGVAYISAVPGRRADTIRRPGEQTARRADASSGRTSRLSRQGSGRADASSDRASRRPDERHEQARPSDRQLGRPAGAGICPNIRVATPLQCSSYTTQALHRSIPPLFAHTVLPTDQQEWRASGRCDAKSRGRSDADASGEGR